MTAPSYPTFNRRGFRMYQGQDGLADVPGVTSVLKNIDKSGLGSFQTNQRRPSSSFTSRCGRYRN
jgi:hypothetical protein